MITTFTPLQSFAGGMLIGLAATLLLLLHGRIAGITGIITGALPPARSDWPWRAAFLVGMLASPLAYFAVTDSSIVLQTDARPLLLLVSGAIVGCGVYVGNGCPSGHGICGLARFSTRSFVAVLTFMAAAVVTVFISRHVIGG